MVPGFPNFFLTYGPPGTHLAHGGSLIFNSELQMRYIGQCLHALADGLHSIEPTPPEATEDWRRRSQEAIKMTVWSHPSIEHSYFKNAHGEIHTVSPWKLYEYHAAVREPDWSELTVRPAGALPHRVFRARRSPSRTPRRAAAAR